jgi:hypothetical protein
LGDCFKVIISGTLKDVAACNTAREVLVEDGDESVVGGGVGREGCVAGVERPPGSGVIGASWDCGGDIGVGTAEEGSCEGMD